MKYETNKIVYEVGDWVRILDTNLGDTSYLVTTQVCSDSGRGNGLLNNQLLGLGNDEIWLRTKRNESGVYCRVRPATQEEIDEATKEKKIMVGEYEVSFDFTPRQWIKVGCQTVSKDLFLKIGEKAGWL